MTPFEWTILFLAVPLLAVAFTALTSLGYLYFSSRRSRTSTPPSPSPTEKAAKEALALQGRMTQEFEPQLSDAQGRPVKIHPPEGLTPEQAERYVANRLDQERSTTWALAPLPVKSSTPPPSRPAGRYPDWTMLISSPAGTRAEVTAGRADVTLDLSMQSARLRVFSRSTGRSGPTTAEPTGNNGPTPSSTSASDSASGSTPKGDTPAKAGAAPGLTHTHDFGRCREFDHYGLHGYCRRCGKVLL